MAPQAALHSHQNLWRVWLDVLAGPYWKRSLFFLQCMSSQRQGLDLQDHHIFCLLMGNAGKIRFCFLLQRRKCLPAWKCSYSQILPVQTGSPLWTKTSSPEDQSTKDTLAAQRKPPWKHPAAGKGGEADSSGHGSLAEILFVALFAGLTGDLSVEMYCIPCQRTVKCSKARGMLQLSKSLQMKSNHGVVMRLLVCVILGSDICKYNLF